LANDRPLTCSFPWFLIDLASDFLIDLANPSVRCMNRHAPRRHENVRQQCSYLASLASPDSPAKAQPARAALAAQLRGRHRSGGHPRGLARRQPTQQESINGTRPYLAGDLTVG